jgi:hypothetical protein
VASADAVEGDVTLADRFTFSDSELIALRMVPCAALSPDERHFADADDEPDQRRALLRALHPQGYRDLRAFHTGGGDPKTLSVDANDLHAVDRFSEYVCYRHRANRCCTNTLRMPVAIVNEAVLNAVEAHALTPEAIEAVIHLSERDDVTELETKLARERKDVEKRIARLMAAIEVGEKPASLVAKIGKLEARLKAIANEVACLKPVPRLAPAVIEGRLAEWRRLLRSSTAQARTVLQRVLRGRLVFTPRMDPITEEADGYDFSRPTRFDRLFTGIAVETPPWVAAGDRRGLEGTSAEDTLDGDYGRLLDRAYERCVKVLASPAGARDTYRPGGGETYELPLRGTVRKAA